MGRSQKVIFEKIENKSKNHYRFLNEEFYKILINHLVNTRFVTHKVKQLSGILSTIPNQIQFQVLTNQLSPKITQFYRNNIKVFSENYRVLTELPALKLDLQRRCFLQGINSDESINNSAQYLQNIEIHFITTFQKQNRYFQFNLTDPISTQLSHCRMRGTKKQNLIIEKAIKNLIEDNRQIKVLRCFWLNDI